MSANFAKLLGTGDGDPRAVKVKSGILDKATTNIQQKQVWPQQNLGEDWADEDVEFKQMKFEHLVAGETRTIETCADPAQILGRLRLLRRISYLKLRGYEWPLIRKMYAAILTSIETKEYSWESNFDGLKQYYTEGHGWNTKDIREMADTLIRNQEAGKDSVATTTEQKVAQRIAHTTYGQAVDPQQPKRQCTTTVQPASSGISRTGNTQKGILTAPTKTDHYSRTLDQTASLMPAKGAGGIQLHPPKTNQHHQLPTRQK